MGGGLSKLCVIDTEAFTAERPEMTLSEVARIAGIDPGTAFRMLNTLVMLGYIARVTLPYLTIMVGFVLLLTLFPGIVTILPRLLYG